MGCKNSVPPHVKSADGTLLALRSDSSPKALLLALEKEQKEDQQVAAEMPSMAPERVELKADEVSAAELEMLPKELNPNADDPPQGTKLVASVVNGEAASVVEETRIKAEEANKSAANADVPCPMTAAAEEAAAADSEEAIKAETGEHGAAPFFTTVAHEVDDQLQSLMHVRKVCGLKDVPVAAALQTFQRAAGLDGKLCAVDFYQAYFELLNAHSIPVPPENVHEAVFDLFDRDANKAVDMMELISGVSLLCAGSEDEKINAVFQIFDENGDGFISMDEMSKFLTSVFKAVLTPNVMSVIKTMGVQVESPEELASVTALECFQTADLNRDDKLSVSEFKAWFNATRDDQGFLFSPMATPSDPR